MNPTKNSDVLIIGGGIIGLSLARALRKKGVRIITILERGKIGRESSFAAAGMLAPQSEADEADEFFHFCDDSKNLYPNFAEELFGETGVDIELDRSGTLYPAFSETDAAEIRSRFAWQKNAGLAVEYLSGEEARKVEPFVSNAAREALFFPNDWQVENRKLLLALQRYAELNSIEINENTEIKNLLIEDGKIVGAETATEKFFAAAIVLAAGAWTSLIKSGENVLSLPEVKPIRGQILSFKTATRLFSKVIYSPRGYIVPRADGRILVGATVEDVGFDKSLTDSGVEFLRQKALEISPNLADYEISDQWAGLRPRAADELPILGTLSCAYQNLFLATGHYRNGILLAPLTAKILAERIVENTDSKYLKLYSPGRFFK